MKVKSRLMNKSVVVLFDCWHEYTQDTVRTRLDNAYDVDHDTHYEQKNALQEEHDVFYQDMLQL